MEESTLSTEQLDEIMKRYPGGPTAIVLSSESFMLTFANATHQLTVRAVKDGLIRVEEAPLKPDDIRLHFGL